MLNERDWDANIRLEKKLIEFIYLFGYWMKDLDVLLSILRLATWNIWINLITPWLRETKVTTVQTSALVHIRDTVQRDFCINGQIGQLWIKNCCF
jgi:hypothetical protein